MSETKALTGAEEVVWDLSDLYPSTDHPSFISDVASIAGKATAFHDAWSGRLATATDADVATLITEYCAILETLDRLGSFAHLRWSTDSLHPEYGRTLQSIYETSAAAWRGLVFVAVEFSALTDERLALFEKSSVLAQWKHWFEGIRIARPHILSEDAEQILAEKALPSRHAWVRLHDERQGAQTFTMDGEELTQATVLKKLYSTDRSTRRAAAASIAQGLQEDVKLQAFIFNTVLGDHAITDRLRNHSTWISSRNQANDVTDASVENLVRVVSERYDLVQRFYALKKRLLGLDVMYDYDRYAPISSESTTWQWTDARAIVTEAFSEFHEEAGKIVTMFFEKPWIHAPSMKGKNGGAYSAGTIPSAHPYVFLNYTGTDRDVQVLAHELGHGVHQYLSRRNGMLLANTPLTIAETASVFGEMLVFNRLMERATTKQEKLSLLVSKIDDIVATVFRQISLNQFESAIHLARRAEGELSVDRFSEIWMQTQTASFGDSITLSEGYQYSWSYISHFMHAPGYVYAYAYGELLVLALHGIYQEQGADFPEKYMDLLRAGGSKSPQELLAPFGIDINDPQFWQRGLRAIEALIEEAEALAD